VSKVSRESVYVEKFVTFSHFGQGWDAQVWQDPSGLAGQKVFRLLIPVPDELIPPTVLADVAGPEEPKA
jgi:hypothetical protein